MSLIQNPFAQQNITGHPAPEEHEPLGSLDKEFQDEIANPGAAEAIQQANLKPRGWYVSDPDNYRPTTFTEVATDEDGTRTGVPGPRNMGVILARVSQTVKEETYTSVVRIKISPDARAKAVWVDDAFDHLHPSKHDSPTRMYAEAQSLHKAARGHYATRITELLEFLAETPFRVNCMVKDDGNLTPWQLGSVGRR